MDKKPEFHGSDLEQIEAYYHIPKEEIVSFGANVNPLGLSEQLKNDLASHLDVITRYPDRDYRSLKKAISKYTGVSADHIVIGNGSTELISLLISTRTPKKALVLGPTYSEYARELSLNGGSMDFYNLKKEQDFQLDIDDFITTLKTDYQLAIICNPNNPTSSALTTGEMERILAACREYGIFVMIDETYVEFAPDIEAVSAVSLIPKYDNFMIIRGVSKFYAAPGLRFGYGMTSNEAFLKDLLLYQNPWSLNSIAAYAGERMFSDADYYKKTRELICSERTYMFDELKKNPNFKPYKAYANFILVEILKEGVTSFDVFEKAIKNRLMIRDCSSFESLAGEFFRFCIMNPADNRRLLDVLNQI